MTLFSKKLDVVLARVSCQKRDQDPLVALAKAIQREQMKAQAGEQTSLATLSETSI